MSTNLDAIWLPKLPVPPLEQTMAGYLDAVQVAVQDENQKAETRKRVEQFMKQPDGIAFKLQDLLIEKQAKEENWAYDWWLEDMYLNNAIALPINSNPGMVFPLRDSNESSDAFVRYIADFVSAILDYKELIDRQLVPQDRALSREKGQPLCMAQYQRLFASYRIPGEEQDQLKTMPAPGDNEHIIVAHEGQFWRLEVRHRGRRLSAEEMAFNLRAVIDEAGAQKDKGVGLLTTANRRLWARWRHQLLQDLINARSLQSIESSSMIVCIDRPLPAQLFNANANDNDNGERTGRDDSNRALQMIHGGGSEWNTANRWFDKTVQFVFSRDGTGGLCYEHSPAEGIVLVQIIEKALEKLGTKDERVEKTEDQLADFPAPRKLAWKIDDEMRRAIETAAVDVDRMAADLDFQVFRFARYGKNRIKTFAVSPDVYVQLALQWTYFKLHGKLVATYESAATRRFRLGRVDNIRSASPASLAWVTAMNDPDSSTEQKVEAFYKAAEFQTDVMIKNILGQGIDIHLLGLRELSREVGHPDAVAVFDDPSFGDINHFSLSTSQIPTTSDSFMGYGPVVPDGYGCSYNPRADCIVFCASSFKSCESTSTRRFVNELSRTLVDMAQILENKSATR